MKYMKVDEETQLHHRMNEVNTSTVNAWFVRNMFISVERSTQKFSFCEKQVHFCGKKYFSLGLLYCTYKNQVLLLTGRVNLLFAYFLCHRAILLELLYTITPSTFLPTMPCVMQETMSFSFLFSLAH